MNNNYSRTYLQNISNENKKISVNNMISQFIDDLRRIAGLGQKSYFYNMTNMQFVRNPIINQPGNDIIPNNNNNQTYSIHIDELLPLFREKFPDCSISYQEIWSESTPGTRVLKKGILIDWS